MEATSGTGSYHFGIWGNFDLDNVSTNGWDDGEDSVNQYSDGDGLIIKGKVHDSLWSPGWDEVTLGQTISTSDIETSLQPHWGIDDDVTVTVDGEEV